MFKSTKVKYSFDTLEILLEIDIFVPSPINLLFETYMDPNGQNNHLFFEFPLAFSLSEHLNDFIWKLFVNACRLIIGALVVEIEMYFENKLVV